MAARRGDGPLAPLALRVLLALFPAGFRAEYGREMQRVFVERRGDSRGLFAVAALWVVTVADLLVTAVQVQWETSRQDLAYAARALRRTPGFTATVLMVAALGIGVNTAAFSLADHVLVRPLPFADADRLVALWQNQLTRGYSQFELSPANFRDWKAASHSFEGMAAYQGAAANLVGEGQPERLEGAAIGADLLPLLGVRPALGRSFAPEDDRDGGPRTLLLSWGLWQGAFGGDPAVVGRRVTLDGQPCTVIGVMPRGFSFPTREAAFWRPLRLDANSFRDRTNTFLQVVAKLKRDVPLTQARAELQVVTERLERAYPRENASVRATVNPLRDELSRQSRLLLLALVAAAAGVLLIACFNLANLMFARAMARRQELALRTALGAGRERLVRQLLTESLLLAVGGGALGVLLAVATLPLLTHLVPARLPVAATPALDWRVLAVAAAMTMFAAAAFGVLPSLRACAAVDAGALREGSGGAAGGTHTRSRLRRGLVMAEVSASLVLLICSGLLLRALWRVHQRDPGFRTAEVSTVRTALPLPKYNRTADRARFYQQVLSQVSALPGVQGAAYVTSLPIAHGGGIWPVTIEGWQQSEGEKRTASLRFVTPDYFSVLGIPLRAGRAPSERDTGDTPPVAVVSESFVRHYWPNGDPLGKRFEIAFAMRTVVGVVGDVRMRGLERTSEPQVYLPYRQVPDGALRAYIPKDLVIRSSAAPPTLMPALRAIVQAADPQQPLSTLRPLEDVVAAHTAPRRVQLYAVGAFAALACVLAGLGIYGVLSFTVARRAREIGVRLALGATSKTILMMVLREGCVLAALGTTVGLALAVVAGRLLEALLAGVKPTDPLTFGAALAIALVMTLVGSVVPALRAARLQPSAVIRAN